MNRVWLLGGLIFLSCWWLAAGGVRAVDSANQGDSGLEMQLNAQGTGPREVEDSTESAIVRDYGIAWKSLETALAQNRADALDDGFVGFARERLGQRVADQKQTGIRVRYLDHGHKLQALFYSPEGSAMQLRDTAQLEVQIVDGDKVISSQKVSRTYIALMTVTEDGWKVRVLQEVP